jgi:hypothetical protein
MRPFGGLGPAQMQALNHPLRLRILEMHRQMKRGLLSVETLTLALTQTPEFEGVKAAAVKYHRDRLVDAGLLPV